LQKQSTVWSNGWNIGSRDALRRDGWTIEDWREKTGRYDDVIAWRVKE